MRQLVAAQKKGARNLDKLIVALDVDTPAEALALVKQLGSVAGMFKVGSRLFTVGGPQIVKDVIASGARVFLDLKFHDIPHQVAGAARSATRLGVSMFTLHASGGAEMMRRAVDAVSETAEQESISRPAVLAVSVLTSIDANTLAQIGVTSSPAETVLRLVKLAKDSGVDGFVASPREAESIRAEVSPKLLIVTPGIRPAGKENGDQRRVATPEAALTAGADYIVVGRPITAAPDPLAAAREIILEMERAQSNQQRGTAGAT